MSYLRNYLKYTERNEANPNYHLWCCLTSIASLLGRKVWLRRPYEEIHPNLYTILVGPQGNRKTAAKNIAQSILRDVGGIKFSSEATTREALIDQMKAAETAVQVGPDMITYCPLTICVTEFKEFLTIDPGRVINFLTTVYDAPIFDYSTRGKGTDLLVNPYVNIIACETPEWLTDRLKERIVSGGFSRRVLYIFETEHLRFTDETLTPEAVAAKAETIKEGQRISRLAGEFKWGTGAKAWFDDWYLKLKVPHEQALVGFYESKHTLLCKVAMSISASESSSMLIEIPHLQLSLELITSAEVNMPRIFAGGGRNELGIVSMKIMDTLNREKRPISEKQIHVQLWQDCKDMREMDTVIGHLIRTEKVIRYKGAKERIMLVAKDHAPEDVLKLLAHAVASAEGSSASDGQPSSPATTPSATVDPLQVFRQSAPKSSAPSTDQPPTP